MTTSLSSTAWAAEHQGRKLGEFVEAGEQEGRPYFVQRDTEGTNQTFLYHHVDDEVSYWLVGNILGEFKAVLVNNLNSHDPPLDQWLYHDDEKWNNNDTTLTLEFTTLNPCQLVRVWGEGNVVDEQGTSLGEYRSSYYFAQDHAKSTDY